MTHQPDFRALFYTLGKSPPRKLRYRLRFDSNYPHDEQFLSSLIHDARWVPEALSLRGRKLLIPLERDCWEYGFTDREDGTAELHNSVAVLRLSPVEDLTWSFTGRKVPPPTEELWIREIGCPRSPEGWFPEPYRLTLLGADWFLRVDFAAVRGDPLVEVEDKTVPALWGQIESNPKLRARFREGE